MFALNSVRHVSVLLLTGFVAYFSFSDGITMFAWHPPFMVIGFLLLMTETIMVFSSVRAFKQKLAYDERLDIHTLLPISACVFIGIGYFTIYCSKVELNHEHYQSVHSNIGYLACISSAGASIIGILARFGGNLKLPVNLIKPFHAMPLACKNTSQSKHSPIDTLNKIIGCYGCDWSAISGYQPLVDSEFECPNDLKNSILCPTHKVSGNNKI